MEDFNRELTPGNTKAAMRNVGASSSDLWKVDPGKLRTRQERGVHGPHGAVLEVPWSVLRAYR